jgi:ankyrin repeat protein
VVELMLDRKSVDPNSKDRNDRTPLPWAARNGHEAVEKRLLATKSVDLDSKDAIAGRTPLSWAAENGHDAAVKLLVEKGPTWNLKGFMVRRRFRRPQRGEMRRP